MATVEQARRAEPRQDEFATLRLQRMGTLGDTISTLEDEEVNVFGGIVGEEVVARIVRYRRRKKHYVSGLVTQVLNPSPHRVTPPCSFFGACTGCQWQHISYDHQLELKWEAVTEAMGEHAELESVRVSNTIPAKDLFGYRNHARFAVRQHGKLVFTNRITRKFVPIDRCMIMADPVNETLATLQDRCQETSSISIRVGLNTGELLIQPTLQLEDVASGQTYYHEKLQDRRFRVSSPSFFQTNTVQAEVLGDLVRDRLELSGDETVVDAYAGVGTFAVLLAPYASRVIAIEEADSAVKDAAINTIGIDNIEFRLGKTEEVLGGLELRPNAVVLDPPRVGCHPAALDAVSDVAPERVVYVSCDPASLARDLAHLSRAGFDVAELQPLDMFPQTHHVECVATLTRRSNVGDGDAPA